MTDNETHEIPSGEADAEARATAEGMPDADAIMARAPEARDAEPESEGDLEFRKVSSGVYGVWLTSGDGGRRVGTVGRIADGEWRGYSSTGHPGRDTYRTRQEAGEALAAGRRK